MEHLKRIIREIPDFPKPGILFYDITTLLIDGPGFKQTVDHLVERYRGQSVDAVLGIEARGFIFAASVAYGLGAGFIPVRKPGKLPYKSIRKTYSLEYGTDALEIHEDAIQPGRRVVLIDDLIATGGTARAVADMVSECGGLLLEAAFVVELEALGGRGRLPGVKVFSMLKY